MSKKSKSDDILWTYHQTDNSMNLRQGHPRQEMILKEVNKLIQKGKILEIGFGDGYLLNKLTRYYECYGADISKSNVSQMKDRIKDVTFNVIDVDGKLPYKDNFFDGFIASEVLEHMDDEELVICIDEIYRVLKHGGIAVITFPAEENLKNNECFCPNCKTKFHKWGHKQSWNTDKIEKMFVKFDIIKLKKFFSPYRGRNFLEKILALGMWLLRTSLNKFISIPGSTYLVILRKK